MTGGAFQEVGFDISIAELTISLCQFGILGTGILSHLSIDLRQELWAQPMLLAEKMEHYKGARLGHIDAFLASIRRQSSSQ